MAIWEAWYIKWQVAQHSNRANNYQAKIEVISKVWSSCLQGSQSCRRLDPRRRSQQVPRTRTHLPALPKARTQAMEQQSIKEQCTSNMTQYMTCYARCDMQCICVLRKEKDEPGINLANQVCRWKDEMISVEIDIKIIGIGCTVCKSAHKRLVLICGASLDPARSNDHRRVCPGRYIMLITQLLNLCHLASHTNKRKSTSMI